MLRISNTKKEGGPQCGLRLFLTFANPRPAFSELAESLVEKAKATKLRRRQRSGATRRAVENKYRLAGAAREAQLRARLVDARALVVTEGRKSALAADHALEAQRKLGRQQQDWEQRCVPDLERLRREVAKGKEDQANLVKLMIAAGAAFP